MEALECAGWGFGLSGQGGRVERRDQVGDESSSSSSLLLSSLELSDTKVSEPW